MKKLSLLLAIVLGLSACTKDRPVQRIPDPNNERWKKDVFTGSQDEPKIWLSKVTVTDTSYNNGFIAPGWQSDLKAGYFQFSKDKLTFYSAETPNWPPKAGSETIINQWNVSHSEYRLSESDGKVMNREEENSYIPWDQKSYFTVDWSGANISEAATFPYRVGIKSSRECWSKASSRMIDGSQEITDDYLSFTVAVDYQQNTACGDMRRWLHDDFVFTVRYKYSYVRMKESDYQPYVYKGETDPIMSKYGFFKTYREKPSENGNFVNDVLMNRWHPKKTHVYYFAKDFPEEYKWMFNDPKIGIFARTNAIFKRHGLDIRFEIRENDGTKEFGDGRYSFVKMYTENIGQPLLGYGPHDVNPYTGEIVAGNLVMYSGLLKYFLKTFANNVSREDSKYAESSVLTVMRDTLGEAPADWTKTSEALRPQDGVGSAFYGILPDFTYGYPRYSRTTRGYSAERSEQGLRYDSALMGLSSLERIQPLVPQNVSMELSEVAEEMKQAAQEHLHDLSPGVKHVRDTTLYPSQSAVAGAFKLLKEGFDIDEILRRTMYKTALHELGHNLNLRHNLYGSVDRKHFKPTKTKLTVGGKEKVIEAEQTTSSIMDYMGPEEVIFFEMDWKPYDEAALVYAYSDGKVDLTEKNNTEYLYCTDEHAPLNALCNYHDAGTTPSEIARSLIEDYDAYYFVRNLRNGRGYWDTSRYASARFGDMWQMKKFLVLYDSVFSSGEIKDRLIRKLSIDGASAEEMERVIKDDVRQAVKLSISFYNAVIQQKEADRHWRDEYDEWSGNLVRKGILADKFFAMLFLMGDDGFTYNPNKIVNYASFVSLLSQKDPELANMMDQVLENALTVRVDMQPWFINFARSLYAVNAFSLKNKSNHSLISRIRVNCYHPESFEKTFDVDVDRFVEQEGDAPAELNTAIIPATLEIKDTYFQASNDRLGVIRADDRFYVASETKNPYAFSLMNYIVEKTKEYGSSMGTRKDDVVEFFRLYNLMTEGTLSDQCQ